MILRTKFCCLSMYMLSYEEPVSTELKVFVWESLSLLTGQWASSELQTDPEQAWEGSNAEGIPPSLSADQPSYRPAAHLLAVPARWASERICFKFRGTERSLHNKLILFCSRSVRFYEGVVELCLTAADKKDPQKLGPHFYRNGEPEEDSTGQQAFQERSVHTYTHHKGS